MHLASSDEREIDHSRCGLCRYYSAVKWLLRLECECFAIDVVGTTIVCVCKCVCVSEAEGES